MICLWHIVAILTATTDSCNEYAQGYSDAVRRKTSAGVKLQRCKLHKYLYVCGQWCEFKRK